MVTEPPAGDGTSLRAAHVASTRAALVAAARQLFGERGYAATSVDDVARRARVTTGALYHHFPSKAALFETVFETVHGEILLATAAVAPLATDEVDLLLRGVDVFFEAVLAPDVQRIMITDAPSVLGLGRFTELDERYAFSAIAGTIQSPNASGLLDVAEPDVLARLLLGALTRGAMLIAASDDPVDTKERLRRTIADLLSGLGGGRARTPD